MLSFESFVDVLRQAFNQYSIPIGPHSSSKDIPGWDSLNHVALLVELEDAFGVPLTSEETIDLPDVGALFDLLRVRSEFQGNSPE